MDKNTFYQYKESQANSGYRAAVLYKEQGDAKYRFLCASETAPFPMGSTDSQEFDLLNSPSKGSVEGKPSAEQKEVELLYTRNNAMLFEKLKGKTIDFMTLTPQFVGYKFNGTISFRPNDATTDIHRGTYTITPMSIDTTPYYMAREEVLEPLFFANTVADEISMASLASGDTTVALNLALNIKGSVATYYYNVFDQATNKEDNSRKTLTVDSDGNTTLPKTKGLYIIYAEPTDKQTYSGCFTSVYITD